MITSNIGKIQVVDDEVELKNVLVEALTAQGYEAAGFNSGEEALAALRDETFDVLLTDLMMPGMDGITLVRESLQIDPHLVCMVMTGQGTIQTAVDAMKEGAFDYVLKPFRLQNVLPVITRAMNTRRMRLENLQLRESIAIHELSQTIAFTLDPQIVIGKLADAALQQTEADEVSVLLPTADGKELYVAAVRGGNRERLLGERVPLDESISGWVAREREPLILDGEVNDKRFRSLCAQPGIRSAISIPMQVAGKLVGTININALDRPRPFTLGQMKALSILAGTAAAALESASLYAQVRQAEEDYRSIFENAVEGIYRTTADGRFITANPAMAGILGYESPQDLIASLTDVNRELCVDPGRHNEWKRRLDQGEKLLGFEGQYRRKDGSLVWLSESARAVRDESGLLLYYEGIVEDITERRQAESAVRESEARLRRVIDATTDGVWDWNKITGENYFSPRWKEILGYRDDELPNIDSTFFDRLNPEDKQEVMEGITLHMETGAIYSNEIRLRHKDGSYRWVLNRGEAVRDADGLALGMAGTITDITERKQSEKEQARLTAILQATTDMVATADVKGFVQYVNYAGRKMLGLGEDQDVTNTRIVDYHPEWAASIVKNVGIPAAIESGFWGGETALLGPDGREIPLSQVIIAHTTPDGTLEYLSTIGRDITEGKRTEAKILGEQLFSESIVNSLPGIFYLIDQAVKFRRWNKNFEQVTGYSTEEIATLSPLDLFVGEEKELIAQRIQEVFASGASDAEAHLVSKSGQRTPYYFTGARIDSNGQPCLIGLGLDITERNQAEEALRESEERYRDLVENSLELITTQDMDGQILSANRAAAKILGYEGEDYAGKTNLREILAPEVRDQLDEYLARIRKDGVASGLMLVQTRTGEKRIWEYYNTLRTEGVGTPIVRSMARDITERKKAETALRESEERYRDLVENAHDIIYSHDLEGNYTSMNKAGGVITGYTREEAMALNFTQTIAPEYLGEAREMIRKKIAGEKVTAYELEIIAKDGHRITVEANTKLVFQDGVPVGVQGIARDVTDRKHLEDQLRQSQKLEGIGQLAGGIAHDFNNLLTAINGYSSLALQRIEGNPSVRAYLEEIRKAGDRAANLTRQLLAFGRKQILQPLPLSLNDIVADMSKLLQRLIGEDIQLSTKLTADLKRVKADPGQIEQVLVNLIVNSRDAMPNGGKLTIETANTELDREFASTHVGVQPGAYVVLAVSDTGTGMDESVRRQIFEPFFTTKEKGKGTGLGLSTVYGIVKQSGGNIWVYSEPNHGTTFKVYLPALAATSKSSAAEAVESPIPVGSETVLLVEDEEVVRGLARQILEGAGYRVLVAQHGEEAIRLCVENAQEIHLLLTDVVMPGAGGKEVADRLGALRPGIKVLFMSGYTDEAIVHHGVLDPNVKFIQKPFSPAALAKKVREVLDSNGTGSAV